MIRVFILIIVAFTTSYCGGGKVVSYDRTQAMNTVNVAVNQMLAGNNRASLSAYKRALGVFIKSADFCNMSRSALLLFCVKPIDNNSHFVDDAMKYAKLGRCESEEQIAGYLQFSLHNDDTVKFDSDKLEEPYRSLYLYRQSSNVEYLIKYINKGSSSDAVKSMMLRLIAGKYLDDGNTEVAERYVNDAIKIDKGHSWRGNLIDDYKILQDIYDRDGKDNSTIVETINLIERSMDK